MSPLEPAEIFTLFFVTLGPLKVLGPFALTTRDSPDAARIAWRAFVIATIAAITGGFLGAALLDTWRISFAALMLSGGAIFFLIAIRQLMEQYEPGRRVPTEPLPPSPLAAAFGLVFPVVLTPYGIAAVIALLARSGETARTAVIVGMLMLVMVLDLLAMLYARRILVGLVPILLHVLGAVLAVMQVALSIQFVLAGLHELKIFSG
jgi:multiple antibiotic resistance protein